MQSYNSLNDDYSLNVKNIRNNQNYVIGKKNKTHIILDHLYSSKKWSFPINILNTIFFILVKKIIIEIFNIENKVKWIIWVYLIFTIFFIILFPIFLSLYNIFWGIVYLLYVILYIYYTTTFSKLFVNYLEIWVYVVWFRNNNLKYFFDNYEDSIIHKLFFKSSDNNI